MADTAPHPLTASLRPVMDVLLQEMALEPRAASSVAWDRPVLVLRSANMTRMQAFAELVARVEPADLHVLSHARDEGALRGLLARPFTFQPWQTDGPYTLEAADPRQLDGLSGLRFETVIFLDPGMVGQKLERVEELLLAIGARRMLTFLGDGTLAEPRDWHRRRLAESAFLRLTAWFHCLLEEAGTAAIAESVK